MDNTTVRRTLACDADTQAAGGDLARQLIGSGESGGLILLQGELGAGKTTFSRGFLHAFGHTGAVKSPTYTLIERYQTPVGEVAHLDLYRLDDPDELEYIGFRDLLESAATLLIEWPERAPALAPIARYTVNLSYHSDGGRELLLSCRLPTG